MNRSKCPRCGIRLGNFLYATECPQCHEVLKHNLPSQNIPVSRDPNAPRFWAVRLFLRIGRIIES